MCACACVCVRVCVCVCVCVYACVHVCMHACVNNAMTEETRCIKHKWAKSHSCSQHHPHHITHHITSSPFHRQISPSPFYIILLLSVEWPRSLFWSFVTMVHAGCVCVAIIHWTLTWTTKSLTCTQMLMHGIGHRGAQATKESLHWKLTLERKSLAAPGNRQSNVLPTELHEYVPAVHTATSCEPPGRNRKDGSWLDAYCSLFDTCPR